MAKSLDRILQTAGKTFTYDPANVKPARALWASLRKSLGMEPTTPNLLCKGSSNSKVTKNVVATWTLTLRAASASGFFNACDKSTCQCRKACVMETAGRQYVTVRLGRDARTAFAGRHPYAFLTLLTHEVRLLERRGEPFGLRLNVASDLRWEYIAPHLFNGPNVRAYDYTKWAPLDRRPSHNYRLTYSHTERWTPSQVGDSLWFGDNVAMVFDAHKHQLPATWNGHEVIDGDLSDYRYDDKRGVIVGLAAKGAAIAMPAGGFVTHVEIR